MMERFLQVLGFVISLDVCDVYGYPVDLHLTGDGAGAGAAPLLVGAAALFCSVVLLAGCMCCRRTKGFQEFTDSTSSHSLSGACDTGVSSSHSGGSATAGGGAGAAAEFTMFPPPAAASALAAAQTPGDRGSVVRFEPLPDLRAPSTPDLGPAPAAAAASRRPAAFSSAVSHGLSANDWFEDPYANFPRSQLKYVRELGRGWFGRAVEGEAFGVAPSEAPTRVVVKILHEDATPTDHMFFLHEARPYRDLCHPNVLRLVGRCLEADPFLILLEACTSGDLKSFLSQNISTAEALSQQGVTLLMCCQIAEGLQFMHQNGFVHTDLAARNCLVTSDLTVKIGDYGISIDTFKEDYYCTSEVALPIRWCAPETLHCTDTTIETKEVTKCANVWSFGVVLWEICEFGKLPYEDLTDDEVIVKILVEGSKCLPMPSRSCPHHHNLYHLMKLCWSLNVTERPPLTQVLAMLKHLYENHKMATAENMSSPQEDEDFEQRWETFKPNSIPVTDNHVTAVTSDEHCSPALMTSNSTGVPPPVFVTDASSSVEKGCIKEELQRLSPLPTHEAHLYPQQASFQLCDSSPLTTSPQPSLTSSSGGEIFIPSLHHRHKSPSLQNLRGSLDDLSECNTPMPAENVDIVKQEVVNEEVVKQEEELHKDVGSEIVNTTSETSVPEPDFDSWLQGVETTDEEDAKFVRKISEAIRDLDNALALEKTSSSSSSPASSKSGSHHSPNKDVTPVASDENVVLDFRLGPTDMKNDRFVIKDVCLNQPDSLLDDSFVEKSLARDASKGTTDSGTDTEDETWRKRIECGEFTAKVKEKSKSVADLMVLTHIDCSDGSDSEPPSLTWNIDRGTNSRTSFNKQRKSLSFKGGNLNTNTLAFASESNIHQAVLGEEFRNTLLKLHEAQKDQRSTLESLDVLPLNHGSVSEETLTNSADPLLPSSNVLSVANDFQNKVIEDYSHIKKDNNFLVNNASEHRVINSLENINSLETEAITPAQFNTMTSPNPTVVPNELEKEKGCSEKYDSYRCQTENSKEVTDKRLITCDSEPKEQLDVKESQLGSVPSNCSTDRISFETVGASLSPLCHKSAGIKGTESSIVLDTKENISLNYNLHQEEFTPEPKHASTPKKNFSYSNISDSKRDTIDICHTDIDPASEVQDMESSSHLFSNVDSQIRSCSLSSSDVTCDVLVQSGISTDSFQFLPVTNSESKHLSTSTDFVEPMQKEDSIVIKSENLANSISESSVILGPCQDYNLDYFKGLKTASNDIDPFLNGKFHSDVHVDMSDACADEDNKVNHPNVSKDIATSDISKSKPIHVSKENDLEIPIEYNNIPAYYTSMELPPPASLEENQSNGASTISFNTSDDVNDVVKNDSCSKISSDSLTLESLNTDVKVVSAWLQHSKVPEYSLTDASLKLDSQRDIDKNTDAFYDLSVEKVSTDNINFLVSNKEEELSMDPDSLNEPCVEGLSTDPKKENNVSDSTNVLSGIHELLVKAETSSDILNSNEESLEGKSSLNLSVSPETELPTVIASSFDKSSESTVNEMSLSLISLDHNGPEFELEEHHSSTFHSSPEKELPDSKKDVLVSFLEHEINGQSAGHEMSTQNSDTFERGCPKIEIEENKDVPEENESIENVTRQEIEFSTKSSSVELKGDSSNETEFPDPISPSGNTVHLYPNITIPENKRYHNEHFKDNMEPKEKCLDNRKKYYNENIYVETNHENNEPMLYFHDEEENVDSVSKSNGPFTKDVPLGVVPDICSNELENKSPLNECVSDAEGNQNVIFQSNDHTGFSVSHSDKSNIKKMYFNHISDDLFDQGEDCFEKWKSANVDILNEEFLHSQKPLDNNNFLGSGLGFEGQDFGSNFHPDNGTTMGLEDAEDYVLDIAKHSTPDDERSSDSGFRDKGSLSESCEDACDEKYNLEDIEAELEEAFNKGGFNYAVKEISGEDDDLEQHTSSEELPHEDLVDKDEITCEVNVPFCDEIIPGTSNEKEVKEKLESIRSPFHISKSEVNVFSDSEVFVPTSNVPEIDLINAQNSTLQNLLPSCTPDLLNLQTNNILMPNEVSLHEPSFYEDKHCNSGKESDVKVGSDIDLKSSFEELNFKLQSKVCEDKNLMLDISKTDLSVLSSELSYTLPEENDENSFMKSNRKEGWFLHHPPVASEAERNIDNNLDSSCTSPKNNFSSEYENINENQLDSFKLNEEFMAAIRHELQEKLPCARSQNHYDPESDGILESDETSQEDRADVTIHYNIYPPPLSPILEERESVSSITTTLSDNIISKGAQQSDSDSEPASPVFVLDSVDVINAKADSKKFEEEIRVALENCSMSSSDTNSFCDKDQKNRGVILEDLEGAENSQPCGPVSENADQNNITVFKSLSPHSECDDDFLVIDVETNQATLLESPKPKSHLAFIKKQIPSKGSELAEVSSPSTDVNAILVLSSDESSHGDLQLEINPGKSDLDEDAFTPDSISPCQEQSHSHNAVVLTTQESEISSTLSDKSSSCSNSIELPHSHGALSTYSSICFSNAYNVGLNSADIVEEISIGVPNNEAAEIISELESSGIINKTDISEDDSDEDDNKSENMNPIEFETSTRFTCDNSSKTESDEDESEGISAEENFNVLESPEIGSNRRSLSLDLTCLQQGNGLKRFQSSDNIYEENKLEDNKFCPATIKVTSCEDQEENKPKFIDTLDLYRRKKLREGLTHQDWSVMSVDAAALSTKAPMPSPEDESWKQIPSMLAFSDLNEMITHSNEDDLREGFADTMSPGYPHDNDEDLMSTSFSLKDSEDIADCYTPDWESEDDTNEEDNNSSSSGEFIWKEGEKEASVKAVDIQASGSASKPFEGHSEFGMEVIAEEEEEEEEEEENEEDDNSMSSESGTEFIPSAWNSEATPNRSALRSPNKKQEQKKNVSFKKQKYHCVYEYPREASDTESDSTDSPSRRRWDFYQPDVDYASYADWELMEGDVSEPSGPDLDNEPEMPQTQPTQTFDFYKLSNVDCDFNAGVVAEDGEFYISGSARPFQFSGANSELFGGNGSEFFPGQLYCSSNDDVSAPPAEITAVNLQINAFGNEIESKTQMSKYSERSSSDSPSLEGISDEGKHLSNELMSKESQQLTTMSGDNSRDVMTEWDKEEKCASSSLADYFKEPGSPGSPIDSSPALSLSPTSGLGELRHTRDRLKLDLPTTGSPFVLEPPALTKRRSVEAIKGEASLLDSGEETEDSGIESSNGTNCSKPSRLIGTTLPDLGITNPGNV